MRIDPAGVPFIAAAVALGLVSGVAGSWALGVPLLLLGVCFLFFFTAFVFVLTASMAHAMSRSPSRNQYCLV